MSLPEPYRTWFQAVVGRPPPDEPQATCDACPLCARGTLSPRVKCCGYAPALPNFRAGGALRDGGAAADRVRARLARARPTAAFLLPTEDEQARFDAEGHLTATEAGRCPYMTDGDRCGIWEYRNAVCATFFCAHGDGEHGAQMWKAAMDLFQFAEAGIAVWAAGECGSEAHYLRSADRARTLDWEAIRALGGDELAAREGKLRRAAAYLTER